MLSDIEHLARQCHRRWLPKWYESFTRGGQGLFHERLDHQFLPVDTGRRRLLTQCRQLSIYSHWRLDGRGPLSDEQILMHFQAIQDHYFVHETGGWRFALYPDRDEVVYDLYTHAFVLFMCVWVYRATGAIEARQSAVSLVHFLNGHFRTKVGFHEQLDAQLTPIPQLRRQDPHMHLLEACLFALESWEEEGQAQPTPFSDLAHELVDVFRTCFWDEANACFVEDYDEQLRPAPGHEDYCEPGHHFEWIWLLHRYVTHFGDQDELSRMRRLLLDFGNRTGRDPVYGGIYNAVTRKGVVVEDDKRIWPLTEALKANAIMLDETHDRVIVKKLMREVADILTTGYMHHRGFWTETLNRDLSVQSETMPGTTPYHIYFGVMEARDILRSRGRSKSWRSLWRASVYEIRQGLSGFLRFLKGRKRVKSIQI